MLQTLVLLGSVVVLAGAILTSTLVTAKNTLQQTIAAKTQTATVDAMAEFMTWAQAFVAKYGTEANWQAQTPQPVFHPMCASKTNCPFNATITWNVTGATAGLKSTAASGSAVSVAQNLAVAVDEQRISATIDIAVSDATGRKLYGGRTIEVTARVFDSQPYVVITGERDLSSATGAVTTSEGDSGGVKADNNSYGTSEMAPSASQAWAYINTIISTTITCENTVGFDETNPQSPVDNGATLYDSRFRSGGSLVWVYQLPCTPSYGVPTAPSGLSDYFVPKGDIYQIGTSAAQAPWKKGDEAHQPFPE